MKKIFLSLILIAAGSAAIVQTGNVGIGTINPGSRLTVWGSIAGGYTAVTANTYTILDNDYYIAWNQATAPAGGLGVFTLPAAAVINQGRVYKIKNNSNNYSLTVNAAGPALIDNLSTILIPPKYTAEIIANGNTATSTTCWELVGIGTPAQPDAIRAALAIAGCASCTAYDAAATDTWLQITGAEYNSLRSNLSGTGAYVCTTAQLSTTNSSCLAGNNTWTQSAPPNQSQVPAVTYPVAMAIRDAGSGNTAGMKLKMSNTSQTGGYSYIPASGAATPNVTGGGIQNTIYYYLIKRPGSVTASGAASFVAIY